MLLELSQWLEQYVRAFNVFSLPDAARGAGLPDLAADLVS